MKLVTKKAQIYSYPTKLLEKIGRVYAYRYKMEGAEQAMAWARWFLPPDWLEKAIPYMKKAMRQAGIKLHEDNPNEPGNEPTPA